MASGSGHLQLAAGERAAPDGGAPQLADGLEVPEALDGEKDEDVEQEYVVGDAAHAADQSWPCRRRRRLAASFWDRLGHDCLQRSLLFCVCVEMR